ncbi:SDR family NAD(P)-dependent oxidoreductase [Streptomyces parvus]|uniref:SDR family NAD(P)-dependent oxidoreductase n=1 Tax=Streptomyces parvus TaxID=66428 RepID=UPI0033D72F37
MGIAAVNGPRSVVLSGTREGLETCVGVWSARGVWVKWVPVDYASHSEQVEEVRDRILADLAELTPLSGGVPMLSTMTGDWVTAGEEDGEEGGGLGAGYWVENLRRPVRFAEATRRLADEGFGAFVEVSAHPVLVMGVEETVDAARAEASEDVPPVVVVGTLRRGEGGWDQFLRSLAGLFVRGAADPDWQVLLGGPHPRVELPTYAFQRRRFWIESVKKDPVPQAADPVDEAFWAAVESEDMASLADSLQVETDALRGVLPALTSWRMRRREESLVDGWRYREEWKPVPAPATTAITGAWTVAVPATHRDTPTVTAVLDGLRRNGADLRVIEVSGADPEALAEQLRRDTADDGQPPAGVLSLLAIDDRPHPDHPELTEGNAATVALVRALDAWGVNSRLWCATSQAVATVDSAEVRNPVQATVWGMGASLALDHPATWGGLLDLPSDIDARTADLLSAVLASGGPEDQVAIRTAGLFARRIVRARLDETATPAAQPWQPHGTVLVTGGTGGVGAQVALRLARDGVEHLVLTSRSGSEARGAAELEAELAVLGAKVTFAACDIADREAVRELITSLPVPLTGVFHLAGAVPEGEQRLSTITLEEFARTIRAKIGGAMHLDELLADRDLEVFVTFSSGSAVWGNAHQAAYGGANAFLDALAHHRRSRGLPGTSIAWGLWGGQGADADTDAQLRRIGVRAMEPRLALDVLRQVLDHGTGHLVATDIDWQRFAPVFTISRERPLLDSIPEVRAALSEGTGAAEPDEDTSGQETIAVRLAGLSPAERDHALLDVVRTQVAAVLRYQDAADVEPDHSFKDLGFDSVTAVELRNRLNGATGMRLPATAVFDYATPLALAAHLKTELFEDEEAAATGTVPLLAELDRLEASVTSLPPTDIEQMRLASRLQGLVAKLNEIVGAGVPEAETLADKLEAATADDIFDLIDKDLGLG